MLQRLLSTRWMVLVTAGILWPMAAGAQYTSPPAPFTLERLGSEDGLSHNAVYAIHQDSLGFIWFGTQDGLNRYDGHEFVVHKHQPDDPRSLSSNWITALFEDHEGRLWVGTVSGLHRMSRDQRSFERFEVAVDGGQAQEVRIASFAEMPDGTLWVGSERGLFRVNAERTRAEPVSPDSGASTPLATSEIAALRVDADGTLWALSIVREAVEATLYHLGERVESFPVPFTFTFHLEPPDRVWVTPERGMTLRELPSIPSPGVPTSPTGFAMDLQDRLWIGTGLGLYVQAPGEKDPWRISTAPPGQRSLTDEVTAMAIDRSGIVWVGTYGGILRHDPNRKAFTHIAHRPGDEQSLISSFVSSMYEDERGDLWVGTYGAGLDQVDRASGQALHHRHRADDPTGLCGDYVWTLAPSSRGILWAGTSTPTFCHLGGDGRFEWHHLPSELIEARLIAEDLEGTLWIGTALGLYRYDPDHRRGQLVGDLRKGFAGPIDSMRIGPDGSIWAGSAHDGRLARHDPVTGENTLFGVVAKEGIWDIHAEPRGRLWLATGNGLMRFDAESRTATAALTDATSDGSVHYSVLPDDAGRLWLGTNKGLLRYDLNLGDEGFRTYDLSDGSGSVEFNRHAAFRNAAGELFFGGMSGVTYFHPDEIHDNPIIPPIVFTDIHVLSHDGERNPSPSDLESIALAPGDYTISFEFAALNYTQSQKNRYAYMMEGFDDDWIDARTQREVRYTNLPPGEFTFRVRGSNGDGVWNEEGVALPISMAPPYWRTWWFRLAALALVVGLMTAAHRARIRRLLGLQRMRLRIAGDLHDELGSDLSGIALASGMVARQDHLTDRDRHRLNDVASTAVRVMEGLRDIVWYINPEHDTVASMVDRMRSVAAKLLDGRTYTFEAGRVTDAEIDMNQRRHLFLAFKELLHNVVRHADAARVDIDLTVRDGTLQLTIADDGKGFDPTDGADGTGLKNLKRRAAQMKGAFEIDSQPTRGTRARLTVPLSSA